MTSSHPQAFNRHAIAASPSLLDAVEVVVGPARFVDMTFPYASNWGEPARCTQILGRAGAPPEREFLMRFKQAGGHAPIATAAEALEADAMAGAARPTAVVGLEEVEAPSSIQALQDGRKALLVHTRLGDNVMALRSLLSNSRYERMFLTERGGRASYVLLAPQEQIKARTDVVFDLAPSTAIEARAMIHDGGHVSEGDVEYSWLWTGPSTHFRMILPHVASLRPRRAEICIPRSEDPANLDMLRVQVDGQSVAHRLERWSETSGKIVVEIPHRRDYCVLTLIVPKLSTDSGSGRLLGLCLDKLILTS